MSAVKQTLNEVKPKSIEEEEGHLEKKDLKEIPIQDLMYIINSATHEYFKRAEIYAYQNCFEDIKERIITEEDLEKTKDNYNKITTLIFKSFIHMVRDIAANIDLTEEELIQNIKFNVPEGEEDENTIGYLQEQ